MRLQQRFTIAALALCGLAFAADSDAQLLDKKTLTLAEAKKVAAAAEAEAKKNKWAVSIAVVDDGGNLLYMQRLDDAPLSSINISIGKATTAAIFKKPTKALEDSANGGRTALVSLPGVTPLQGGLPVMAGGKVIGAVGVSGVAKEQDEQVAKAGVDIVK